jgi:hypothetical protein
VLIATTEKVQDKEIYRLYIMAQRPVRPPARLQEDVLAIAVAQPIDLDPAPPQSEPVSPVLKMNSFRHRTWT